MDLGWFTRNKFTTYLFWVVVIGLVLRLVVAVFLTYPNDAGSWARIAESIQANTTLYARNDYYYSPIWGYVLATISGFASLIGVGSFGNQFDQLVFLDGFKVSYYNSLMITPEFAIIIKIFLIAVDLAVAFLIREMITRMGGTPKTADIGFAVWFLCPLTIYSSSAYVIFDNLEVLFLILCIMSLASRKHMAAGVFLLLSIMTKPFPAYLLPLFAVFVILTAGKDRYRGFNNLVNAMFGFLVGFLMLYFPLILNGEFTESFIALTNRTYYASVAMDEGLKYILILISTFSSQVFIWLQPLIIGSAFYIAYRFYKNGEPDLEQLLKYSLIILFIVFIWPVSQQCYYLPMIMIMSLLVMYEGKENIWTFMILVSVPSVLYLVLSHNYSLLLPLACYTDLIPLDWVVDKLVDFTLMEGFTGGYLYDSIRLFVQAVIMVFMIKVLHMMLQRRSGKVEAEA